VVKKNVAMAAVSVSSMEAFPMAGLALQLEVPTMAASIPVWKVGEEYWNFGLDGRLQAVAATLEAAWLQETFPTASRMFDPYENPVT
jgi:hypothetical protein